MIPQMIIPVTISMKFHNYQTILMISCCFSITGRDLIGVQNLMKKHQALQTEIAGHEPRITSVSGVGEEMIEQNHFAKDDIEKTIERLNERWQGLKVCVDII